MSDIYDWEIDDKIMLRRLTAAPDATTRVACKDCGRVYVRPMREYGMDVVFLGSCRDHDGWIPEGR